MERKVKIFSVLLCILVMGSLSSANAMTIEDLFDDEQPLNTGEDSNLTLMRAYGGLRAMRIALKNVGGENMDAFGMFFGVFATDFRNESNIRFVFESYAFFYDGLKAGRTKNLRFSVPTTGIVNLTIIVYGGSTNNDFFEHEIRGMAIGPFVFVREMLT